MFNIPSHKGNENQNHLTPITISTTIENSMELPQKN
jgi:hypothetical protein